MATLGGRGTVQAVQSPTYDGPLSHKRLPLLPCTAPSWHTRVSWPCTLAASLEWACWFPRFLSCCITAASLPTVTHAPTHAQHCEYARCLHSHCQVVTTTTQMACLGVVATCQQQLSLLTLTTTLRMTTTMNAPDAVSCAAFASDPAPTLQVGEEMDAGCLQLHCTTTLCLSGRADTTTLQVLPFPTQPNYGSSSRGLPLQPCSGTATVQLCSLPKPGYP